MAPSKKSFQSNQALQITFIKASKTRPSNTTQYAAGDVINEDASAGTNWTFTDAAREKGGGGIITGARLIDSANQSTLLQADLFLFTAAPTADNDNAAFTPTDSELDDLACIIPLSGSLSSTHVGDANSGANGNAVLESGYVNKPFVCASDSTSLYGVLVARNAYTPVSAEVFTIILDILQ